MLPNVATCTALLFFFHLTLQTKIFTLQSAKQVLNPVSSLALVGSSTDKTKAVFVRS